MIVQLERYKVVKDFVAKLSDRQLRKYAPILEVLKAHYPYAVTEGLKARENESGSL